MVIIVLVLNVIDKKIVIVNKTNRYINFHEV